jgi:hypothetical protein
MVEMTHCLTKLQIPVLSFAGRLQLIQSVLYSIQMYWSSIFILPKKVIKAIEYYFNHYLWQGKCTGRGGIRVAWDKVCLPKKGGLGLCTCPFFNKQFEWAPNEILGLN